jgi:hypothetical protein
MSETVHPMAALAAEMKADPDYAWAWLCNLAVPIMDVIEGATHQQANQAAALIMRQMFDCDVTTHPHYEGRKSFQQEYFELRVAAEAEEDRRVQ